MATDNYLKVHRRPRHSVEFFFDSRVSTSVASAHAAAREFAQAMTDVAQAEADTIAERNKSTPQVVEGTPVVVWMHGVKGLGDLHCVGGCELCAPRGTEDEEELDAPMRVALP